MSMDEELLFTREGAVAVITLNRPDRMNAVYHGLMLQLAEMLTMLEADADVGAIVLTGSGMAFCAGGDTQTMVKFGQMPFETRVAMLKQMSRVPAIIRSMPKLVIAAVNGPAVGAGLTLAAACDMRIAAPCARFAAGFGKMGLSGDMGGSHTLPRLIGPMLARDLYFTGRMVDVEEALRIGLVNEIAPDNACLSIATAHATRIAQGARVAYGYMKRNMLAAETETFERLLEIEVLHQQRCAETEDHAEAKQARAEKREPIFKGR